MKLLLSLLLLASSHAATVWDHPTGNYNPQALAVDVGAPQFLYTALKEGGLRVLRTDGKRPREVAHVKKTDLAGLDAMNLWQEGDLLLVALGDFFKAGSHAGLAAVDVSVPQRPKVLSVWKSEEPMHGSAVVICDAKKKYAYLGGMDHGVLIFDISTPKKLKHVTTFQPDIHFPKKNPNRIQMPNARGMQLKGKHLYLCYDAGGLRALDISDPSKPKEIGRYINEKMGGKQSAYNNVQIDGDRAYVAIDYAGIEILDISDPRRMRQLGWWNPWKAETNSNTWFNSPGHTNQIVFDQKRKLVHLSAGDSEMVTINVTEHRKPKLVGQVGEPKNGEGVWGLCANKSGDTIYLGYIRTIIPFRGKKASIRAVQ